MANDYSKYKLFRKYKTEDGVNYTPLDEYQALYESGAGVDCSCGYREYKLEETGNIICGLGERVVERTLNYSSSGSNGNYDEYWYNYEGNDLTKSHIHMIECIIPPGKYDRRVSLEYNYNTLGYELVLVEKDEVVVTDKFVYTRFGKDISSFKDCRVGYDSFNFKISSGTTEIKDFKVILKDCVAYKEMKEIEYCPTDESYTNETGNISVGNCVGAAYECGYCDYKSVKNDPIEYIYGYEVGLDETMKYEKNSIYKYNVYDETISAKTEYFVYENPVTCVTYDYFAMEGVFDGADLIKQGVVGVSPFHTYKLFQKNMIVDNGTIIPKEEYIYEIYEENKYYMDYTMDLIGTSTVSSSTDNRNYMYVTLNKGTTNNSGQRYFRLNGYTGLTNTISIYDGGNKYTYPLTSINAMFHSTYSGSYSNPQYRVSYVRLPSFKDLTLCNNAFNYCKALHTVDATYTNVNPSQITNCSSMFNGCSILTSLILGNVTQEQYDWWYQRLVDAGIQDNVTITYNIV